MSRINHLFQLLRQRNEPVSYQLLDKERGNWSQLPDGTQVVTDNEDRIIQVDYGTGVKVVRHPDYVLVQSAESSFWFGNSQGQWYQFD